MNNYTVNLNPVRWIKVFVLSGLPANNYSRESFGKYYKIKDTFEQIGFDCGDFIHRKGAGIC